MTLVDSAASRIVRRLAPRVVQRRLRSIHRAKLDKGRAAWIRSTYPPPDLVPVPCAICGNCEPLPHYRFNGFNICRCGLDGLLFVSPRPANLAPYYTAGYYQGEVSSGYENYATFAQTDMMPRWEARLETVESMTKERDLLDVGCADGSFLSLARGRGWRGSGIELSEWAANEARAKGITVRVGSLPDSEIGSASVDVATMWDVIEHVANPIAVLVDIERILRPDGILVLSTGRVPHLDPDIESGWYFPPWHLYYWSEQTLGQALQRAGLEVAHTTVEYESDPYAIMVVTARKRRG